MTTHMKNADRALERLQAETAKHGGKLTRSQVLAILADEMKRVTEQTRKRCTKPGEN